MSLTRAPGARAEKAGEAARGHVAEGPATSRVGSRLSTRTALALFFVVAACYLVGAELSWQSFGADLGFAFFPPAGVTVAAMLLFERKYWPVVLAAVLVCEVGVDTEHHLALATALGYAAANMAEPLVGASFVRALRPNGFFLGRRHDVLVFIAGAVLIGPLVGGVIGATVKWAANDTAWFVSLFQWWAGDGVAVLAVGAPIVLVWQRRRFTVGRRVELCVVAAAMLGLSIVAFRWDVPPALLLLPVGAYAAFRLGDVGVTIVGGIFAFVANYVTAAGYGTFAELSVSDDTRLAITQTFIAVVILVSWFVAIEVDERVNAERERLLAHEERDRAEVLGAAARLGTDLADSSDVDAAAAQIISAVHSRLRCSLVVINLLDPTRTAYRRMLSSRDIDASVTASAGNWPVDAEAPGPKCVRNNTVIVRHDSEAIRAEFTDFAAVSALMPETLISLPLTTAGRPIGYLTALWADRHEVNPLERQYLEAVADIGGRVLDRARDRAERDRAQLAAEVAAAAHEDARLRAETLQQFSAAMSTSLTPEQLGHAIAEHLPLTIECDGLAFGVVDETNSVVQWLELTGAPEAMRRAGLRSALTPGTALCDVVRHGEAVVIPDATELGAQYPDVRRYIEVTGGRAYVGLPLRGRAYGDVIGVLALHWARARMPSADETAYFTNVAQLAGQALLRARTYADEHAVATILQNAVLPSLPARLERFAVGACYRPATRLGGVGGDWYDALDLPGSRTFFTVGDVVGHGVPAAEDMAQLRNAARTLAFEGHDPARVLTYASLLTERTTRGGFATIVVAIHDPAADAVLCATAGHPPMLVRDAQGNVTTIEAPTGPPLGAVSGETYSQVTVPFAPGDTAVLYSDGLVERVGVSIRDGLDRLRAALREWDGTSSLDELCLYLVARCAPEDDRRDDACVLAFARSC